MARQLKVSIILESIADSKGFKAFNAEMNKTNAVLKRMAPTLDAIKSVFKTVATAGGIAGGAFAAVAAKSIEYASNIKDLSDQAGVSTDAIQALGFVALNNGADMDVMAKAMVQASAAAADAANGNEATAKKFARLGISAAEFAKLAPEKQMERMGRAINAANGEQEALAAAMDIVGAKNAPKLMAALRELGEKGYGKVADEAARAGNIMARQTVDELDRAGDRLKAFGNKLTIWAANWVEAAGIVYGFAEKNKVAEATAALAEVESRLGKDSVQAAEAHLKLAEALAEEGKQKLALAEFGKAKYSAKYDNEIYKELGFAEKRGEAARQIQAINDRFEAEEKAKKDRAESVGVADKAEAARVAAEAAEKERAKQFGEELDAALKAHKKEEDVKTKLSAEAAKERQTAVEQMRRDDLVAAERYQHALDAVLNPEVNDYQKRGLQLGAMRTISSLPSSPFAASAPALIAPAPTFFAPNNAGKEDGRVPSLLESINSTLGIISRNGGMFA